MSADDGGVVIAVGCAARQGRTLQKGVVAGGRFERCRREQLVVGVLLLVVDVGMMGGELVGAAGDLVFGEGDVVLEHRTEGAAGTSRVLLHALRPIALVERAELVSTASHAVFAYG